MAPYLELRSLLGTYWLSTWEAEPPAEERVEFHDWSDAQALLRRMLWVEPDARAGLCRLVGELDGALHGVTVSVVGTQQDAVITHAAHALVSGRLRLYRHVELMCSEQPMLHEEQDYVAPVNEIDDAVWVLAEHFDPVFPIELESELDPEPTLEFFEELGPDPRVSMDNEFTPGPQLELANEQSFERGLELGTEHELARGLELANEVELHEPLTNEAKLSAPSR